MPHSNIYSIRFILHTKEVWAGYNIQTNLVVLYNKGVVPVPLLPRNCPTVTHRDNSCYLTAVRKWTSNLCLHGKIRHYDAYNNLTIIVITIYFFHDELGPDSYPMLLGQTHNGFQRKVLPWISSLESPFYDKHDGDPQFCWLVLTTDIK